MEWTNVVVCLRSREVSWVRPCVDVHLRVREWR